MQKNIRQLVTVKISFFFKTNESQKKIDMFYIPSSQSKSDILACVESKKVKTKSIIDLKHLQYETFPLKGK